MTRRPDIVLLILDTQRADRLSCYGHRQPLTPQIDDLAAKSTLFNYAFSPAQWTIPSHASMFTGVYPAVHRTTQSFSVLPDTLPTMAERLHHGGYHTAAFCNNPLVGVINNGLRRGFHNFVNYSGWFTSQTKEEKTRSDLIENSYQWLKQRVSTIFSHAQDAFARSEALLILSFTPLVVPIWQKALSVKGNTVKALNDAAKLLVERRGIERDQPIFSFINLMDAHTPYRPRRRFVERFAPRFLRDKAAQRYLRDFNSNIYGWNLPLSSDLDEERKSFLDGMYNAEVAGQDDHVGEFLQKLEDSGRLDNTMLIVCSDHGDHLGEKHLIGHAFSTYNELVRVPLIIHDPTGDLQCGTTVDHFVSTRRLFHTVLDAAGLAAEEEQAFSLACHNGSDPDKGVVLSEAEPQQQVVSMLLQREPQLVHEHRCNQTRYAACSEGFKLVQVGNDHIELYNLHEDPSEQMDLHPILPERVETLQDYLDRYMNSTDTSSSIDNTNAAAGFDDPQVRRRLRDLGYLE